MATAPACPLYTLTRKIYDVVRFYRRRFDMRLSDQEQVDLVAFRSSL